MILDIYTEEHGLLSFIVGGVRKAKSRQANIFHPMNIIECVAYKSEERLNRIKEAQLLVRYESLNLDVVKSSVAMFVVDLSRNAIKERESNEVLYQFLKHKLIDLDTNSPRLRFFPHLFALELSHYLGFAPNNNYDLEVPYFDLLEGAFIDNDVRHKHILDEKLSLALHQLISGKADPEIAKEDRNILLDKLVEYYKLHLEGFRDLKCLDVLRSVLS